MLRFILKNHPMQSGTPGLPQVGSLARVRQRLYLVESIRPPVEPGDSPLVSLACVEDDAQGQRLDVLWDIEPDARAYEADRWHGLGQRDFDDPALFAAYVNTLRWNCVTATDATLLQAPFRAGIRIEDYQLEPLRKALKLPRVNLFIADDVGLGKTIEAGLIARELLLRKKVREIVVSCPPSMLQQWQEELEWRFGLRFEILDRDYVAKVRRERGFSVNPWTTHPRLLVSHRLLIDDSYTATLRDWLDEFPRPGTLFILDEAHHAAPSSGAQYAIDTKITRAIRDLAPRFEHRLFLSATPHNGHSNSFSTLLSLLDNQRFTPGMLVSPKLTEPVLVRRLKDDLRKIRGGFSERRVEQIDVEVPVNQPELLLCELLDEYRQIRDQRLAGESKRVQASSALLICGLQQRMLSSVEAFARTLRVHRRTVEKHWAAEPVSRPTIFDLSAPDADDDRAELSPEDQERDDDLQIEAASEAALGANLEESLYAKERALLDRMTELAESSHHLPDGRIHKLEKWIRENCLVNGQWTNRRVLIFTEWEDTLRYLRMQVERIAAGSDPNHERVRIYRGSTSKQDRESLRDAFNAPPEQHPLRILIATDAAREGLNLQAHCQHLFHFDIPWNPSRLEQRNGRIDRKLQPSPTVWCYYFFYPQRREDLVLQAIVRKSKKIRQELGSTTQVIEPKLAALLKSGIRRGGAAELAEEVSALNAPEQERQAIEEELESSRRRETDLREQLESLQTIREKSEREIDFSEEHFHATLDCALALVGCDRLQQVPGPEDEPPRYAISALDRQAGSGWVVTTDTLRAKRQKDQNVFEWRREAPVRPVVFRDPNKVTDEVVQLHLEHPVVQRLLQRFLSQGFVHDDLSRTCLAQSRDSVARVVLLGRLALYGPQAARLHEEIVAVTARWTDSKIRREPLTPYERDREAFTLNLLYKSLIETPPRAIPEVVRNQLRESAPADVTQLSVHLQERAGKIEQAARAALERRGNEEAEAMLRILEAQRKQIEAKQKADLQLVFESMEEEVRRQREAERRFQNERLERLPEERATEPERIRAIYNVQASRVEPVGLIYLWPVGA
ncbi:MAG TPA: DISARM system SNF2-like helicase DrmD [Bryobacteraceae bacterium]